MNKSSYFVNNWKSECTIGKQSVFLPFATVEGKYRFKNSRHTHTYIYTRVYTRMWRHSRNIRHSECLICVLFLENGFDEFISVIKSSMKYSLVLWQSLCILLHEEKTKMCDDSHRCRFASKGHLQEWSIQYLCCGGFIFKFSHSMYKILNYSTSVLLSRTTKKS